jgi:RNA polymerase sigma-70 factor (ECF subfamily)
VGQDFDQVSTPKSKALAALVLLQGARLPARADGGGDIVLLEDQGRTLWGSSWIGRGIYYLDAAAEEEEVS